MGRKTWESIGKALPGRQNLVVTRNEAYAAEGCQVVASLVEAIETAEGTEVMVIGGGELYRQALPLASRMVLTTVDLEPECDTWFPAWDPSEWTLVSAEQVPRGDGNELAFEVVEWMRG
jgi:dihydrofolate reductase